MDMFLKKALICAVVTIRKPLEVAMKKELPSCPVQVTLSLIDNKWKTLIIGEIMFEGTQRFGELRRALPGISQKVLTQNLRLMEDCGLIKREIFAEVPPRVEYSLTDFGIQLAAHNRFHDEMGRGI